MTVHLSPLTHIINNSPSFFFSLSLSVLHFCCSLSSGHVGSHVSAFCRSPRNQRQPARKTCERLQTGSRYFWHGWQVCYAVIRFISVLVLCSFILLLFNVYRVHLTTLCSRALLCSPYLSIYIFSTWRSSSSSSKLCFHLASIVFFLFLFRIALCAHLCWLFGRFLNVSLRR